MAVEVEHIGLHGVLATKLDAHLAACEGATRARVRRWSVAFEGFVPG